MLPTKAHLEAANLYAEKLYDVAKAAIHYKRVIGLNPEHPQAEEIRDWLNLANIKNSISEFHAVEGRYPKSLNELVKEGYYSKMPAAPRGMRYVYNPKTGQVGVK